jgi:hypothetical protein
MSEETNQDQHHGRVEISDTDHITDGSTTCDVCLEPNENVQGCVNLDDLRLDQNFESLAGVKKSIVTIPIMKPHPQSFVRVMRGPENRFRAAILEDKIAREIYLVQKGILSELSNETVLKVLFPSINRNGDIFVWPIKLPGPDGRLDRWNESALQAAKKAEDAWIRVVSNGTLGAYDVYEASGNFPDPEWPELSLEQILQIAFRGRVIDSLEHPVVLRLRGRI